MLMKNSKNEKSVSFTFAVVSFIIVSLAVIIGIIESLQVGAIILTFRSVDASVIFAYLTPILGLYFGRRFTEARYKGAPPPTSGHGDNDTDYQG